MNVLIFGGNGYVGRYFVNYVLEHEKWNLILSQHKSRVDNCFDINKLSVITGEYETIENYLKNNTVDWIINFVGVYEKSGISMSNIVDSNCVLGIKLLTYAIEYGVKNFMTIDTALPDSFNLYSFTKKRVADFGRYYANNYDINIYNIILEMYYGKDEPLSRFLPMCIRKMKENEDILLTEGTQKRDIIHIDDVCRALNVIMKSNLIGYNDIPVGTGDATSIREIIEYIHSLLGSSSALRFGAIPMRNKEPDSLTDLSILNNLQFNCKYNWRDGIRNILER